MPAQRSVTQWLTIVSTVSVALAATVSILLLRQWADRSLQTVVDIASLQNKFARLDGIEERVTYRLKANPEDRSETKKIIKEIDHSLDKLKKESSLEHATLSKLSKLHLSYGQSVLEILDLLSAPSPTKEKIIKADTIDETITDITFDEIGKILSLKSQKSLVTSRRINQQADMGTVASIMLSAIAISLIVRKIEIANRLVAIAMTRQQALETNEVALKQERDQLEDRIAKRTQELHDKNVSLVQTLDQLRATQEELIQSEKLAALGHLVAGIAHEINTPLGAIQAAVSNMNRALQEIVTHLKDQVKEQLYNLDSDERQLFFLLISKSLESKPFLSSLQKRPLRQALTKTLAAHNVEKAQIVADRLMQMGIHDEVEAFLPLLKLSSENDLLQFAYNLNRLHSNSQTITMAVDRASKTVFALKSYARFETTDKQQLAYVSEGIEIVLELYKNLLKHGIEVIRDYESLPKIFCYPDELVQVWTNLIHNAIQAMEGRGQLAIAIRSTDSHVLIHITDSGPGIPEAMLSKLFEPFFTTKPRGEGSGLGLSICKKIIDKHAGTIDISSQPGKTTFTVSLPLEPNHSEPE